MPSDQSAAPILEAIQRYHERGDVNFTPPGHRGGPGAGEQTLKVLGEDVFAHDIDLLNGLDDRTESQGVLTQAQELMASALGVSESLFATSGSTMSVKAALLALADLGEKVIVARNSHKSMAEAIILAGVDPVFAPPQWDEHWEISHPPRADTIATLLDCEPEAKAVFLVSPTDYGVAADLHQIAAVCHERGTPLVVDEAWAAHFPWHPDLPASGIQAGADLVIQSVHKSGAGLLQASVLHINGDLVDADEIGQRMDLVSTTSPATPIYASIDGCRHMALHGEALISRSLEIVRDLHEQVAQISGLTPLGPGSLESCQTGGLDPYKLTIDVTALNTTGFEVVEQLRRDHRVNLLLGDRRRVTAMLTPADDQARLTRLLDALRAVAASPDHDPGPGIPVLLPGERITPPVLEYLTTGANAGFLIPDAADPTMETIRVVST